MRRLNGNRKYSQTVEPMSIKRVSEHRHPEPILDDLASAKPEAA
jgi:hypothetical protein